MLLEPLITLYYEAQTKKIITNFYLLRLTLMLIKTMMKIYKLILDKFMLQHKYSKFYLMLLVAII